MRATRFALPALLVLLLPLAVGAQGCGPDGAWVDATAGLARFDIAGGVDAVELGADVGFRIRGLTVGAGYRRFQPESGTSDPAAIRIRVAAPLVERGGVALCAVGHGGGSRFGADGADATLIVGGLGLRAERPLGRFLPYVELRGLAASLSGRILDSDLDGTGLAVGGEAGVDALFGPWVGRVAVGVNGLDGALGPSPYPARVARLGLGYRLR